MISPTVVNSHLNFFPSKDRLKIKQIVLVIQKNNGSLALMLRKHYIIFC